MTPRPKNAPQPDTLQLSLLSSLLPSQSTRGGWLRQRACYSLKKTSPRSPFSLIGAKKKHRKTESGVVYMTRGGNQTKGMPPPCVSYYHMSPDLMGLTAISTITAQLPVRGRQAQAQRSFCRIQVTGGSKQEKVAEGHFKQDF